MTLWPLRSFNSLTEAKESIAFWAAYPTATDCTEDDSAQIKGLLDVATDQERRELMRRWPLEFDEWLGELADGLRDYEEEQVVM